MVHANCNHKALSFFFSLRGKIIDGYTLFYAGKNNTRNGVGIVVGKDFKEKIVGVKRLSNRIITIKLVLEEDTIHIISACAPQA